MSVPDALPASVPDVVTEAGPARPHCHGRRSPVAPSPIPEPRPGGRRGPNAYDDLEPDLARHASSERGDPGYEDRRERLIREFLPLVHNLARRFVGSHSVEDLEQAGIVGLIKALDRYDPERTAGGPLAFMVPTVRGEMLRHLRDHTWDVRVPRDLKDLAVSVNRAASTLSQRLGRSARPSELAEELDVPLHRVLDTLGALDCHHLLSLDQPDPESGMTVAEQVGDDDPALDLADHRGDLSRLVGGLPDRERTILLLRFHGGWTQLEIGEHIGVSQMQVSRLLRRTLERLRAGLTAVEPEPAGHVAGRRR